MCKSSHFCVAKFVLLNRPTSVLKPIKRKNKVHFLNSFASLGIKSRKVTLKIIDHCEETWYPCALSLNHVLNNNINYLILILINWIELRVWSLVNYWIFNSIILTFGYFSDIIEWIWWTLWYCTLILKKLIKLFIWWCSNTSNRNV